MAITEFQGLLVVPEVLELRGVLRHPLFTRVVISNLLPEAMAAAEAAAKAVGEETAEVVPPTPVPVTATEARAELAAAAVAADLLLFFVGGATEP